MALHPPGQASPYPIEVHHRIRKDESADYLAAARALDGCVDVVSIQHEYGIWGGQDGGHVIDFIRSLRVPAVATLHTVLRHPTPGQRAVLSELVARTAATVVMSRSAATLLTSAYGVDADRLDVIPHGVPDLPLVDPSTVKPGLGVAGRKVILSFGLLGPGQGIRAGARRAAGGRRKPPIGPVRRRRARPIPISCARRARPIARACSARSNASA